MEDAEEEAFFKARMSDSIWSRRTEEIPDNMILDTGEEVVEIGFPHSVLVAVEIGFPQTSMPRIVVKSWIDCTVRAARLP